MSLCFKFHSGPNAVWPGLTLLLSTYAAYGGSASAWVSTTRDGIVVSLSAVEKSGRELLLRQRYSALDAQHGLAPTVHGLSKDIDRVVASVDSYFCKFWVFTLTHLAT